MGKQHSKSGRRRVRHLPLDRTTSGIGRGQTRAERKHRPRVHHGQWRKFMGRRITVVADMISVGRGAVLLRNLHVNGVLIDQHKWVRHFLPSPQKYQGRQVSFSARVASYPQLYGEAKCELEDVSDFRREETDSRSQVINTTESLGRDHD